MLSRLPHLLILKSDTLLRAVSLCLLFVACVSLAQPQKLGYSFQLKRLSTEEGLSQGQVNDIAQDDMGYLWFATSRGLNRYDGYEIQIYPGTELALRNDSIVAMHKLSNGKLLVSTTLHGVYLVDPASLASRQVVSEQLDGAVISAQLIQQDYLNPNQVWLAIGHALYSLDLPSNELTHLFDLPDQQDRIRVVINSPDSLYIGATSGLFGFQNNELKSITYLSHQEGGTSYNQQNVKLLRFDSQLGLLVGTVEGLYAVDLKGTGKSHTVIASENIWDIQLYGKNKFIATDNGLLRYSALYDSVESVIRFDDSHFPINDNSITDIFRDRHGNFWLSSRTQGVYSWSPSAMRFKHIQLATDKYKHGHIAWGMTQTKDGTLWVGSENGLNAIYSEQQMQSFLVIDDEKLAIGENSIYSVKPLHSNDSQLLVERSLHAGIFDIESTQFTELTVLANNPEILEGAFFYGGTTQVPNGDIYFFSNLGFHRFNPNTLTITQLEALNEQFTPEFASGFLPPLPTHPQQPVFSHRGDLYRYNPVNEQAVLVYKSENTHTHNYTYVDGWVIDNNNTLWLASGGEGLIALDLESYEIRKRIGIDEGLNSLDVYAPVVDNYGFVWSATNNGLYRIDTKNFHVRHFSVFEGLPASEFNGKAAFKRQNGHLMFGSIAGLVSFNPEDFVPSANQFTPQAPKITDISLLSRNIDFTPSMYLDTPLALNHDDIGLTISFSSFNFGQADKVRYDVQVTGVKNFEYPNFDSNQIQFPQLVPGRHTFSIRAFDPLTSQWSQKRSLNINVAYAPWRSPMAITLYVVSFVLLLGSWFLWVRRQQLQLKKAHSKVLHSQQETELALKSNNSGVWHYDIKQRHFVQSRLNNELGYTNKSRTSSFEQFAQLIHPQDVERYRMSWKRFLNNSDEQNWECTYRLVTSRGNWLWFHEVGQVSERDENEKPTEISGIYTNITDTKASAQQAAILGEAFAQISDWLLILDANLRPFAANDSFLRAFGLESQQQLGSEPIIEAIGSDRFHYYIDTLTKLKPGENLRQEDVIKNQHQIESPIHISTTAIGADGHHSNDEVSYYVIVVTDLTEQKRAEEELRYLANYDPLTKLPNRSMMLGKINTAIEQAQRASSLVALLFIDLDKFKPVNDSFGHAVGDEVLCCICERINALLDNNSLLGRQSGDEFLLLVEKVENPKALSELATQVASSLEAPIKIGNITINISVSIGIALSPFDANNADDLIRNADMAMIYAKNAGRNGYKFFTEQMNNRISHKLIMENKLQDAVRDGLLMNHYQPIVHDRQKRIVGVELLMRWPNGDGGFVSPAEFIPIAEEIGLIDAITEQALHRALMELSPWFKRDSEFYLSLNLSPIHILKSNLSERLKAILEGFEISPSRLRLEITENSILEDKDKAASQLARLKSQGFKLFLDDFGTGYSSLTYLSQFPIDVIKIDQSFVRQIGINPVNESIIRTIQSLASSLGIYCIAEGVETKEQRKFLNKLGCHYLQGYYFARPCDYRALNDLGNIKAITEKLHTD